MTFATVDVYLYEVATGRILQRAIGAPDAVAEMLNDDVSGVEWVPDTSDATHKVDLATGQVVPK